MDEALYIYHPCLCTFWHAIPTALFLFIIVIVGITFIMVVLRSFKEFLHIWTELWKQNPTSALTW